MSPDTSSTSAARYPSLHGRRVLVTGGGSGIGAAVVEAFAAQGAQVWFLDVLEAESRELVARLATAGRTPRFSPCDLTDLAQLKQVLDALLAESGGFDVLVNNAANDTRHALAELTPQGWDASIAVNLRHLLFCAQAVAPGMQAAGGGAIVNFGSISWHLAIPDLILYETAKAGIEGMTRALARDLGVHRIRVNCVGPGGVRTPRQARLWHNPDEEARMLAQQCLKQRVEPADVAAMVLFLAADDSRMCTAHSYFVDAGWR